jgi:hypothetical protein
MLSKVVLPQRAINDAADFMLEMTEHHSSPWPRAPRFRIAALSCLAPSFRSVSLVTVAHGVKLHSRAVHVVILLTLMLS